MARYRRSIPDPSGRTNRRGYVRRRRRPAGTAARARSSQAHRENPRRLLNARLAGERDPLRRVEHALGYLRSAATKYEVPAETYGRVERAVIRAGDQAFAARRLASAQIANNRTRSNR